MNQKTIEEDGIGMVGGIPTVNASGGDVAGLGVGPQGEPGIKKKKKVIPFTAFIRRKK